jgi:hypothetical protein
MSDTEIRAELNSLDVKEFLQVQHEFGRADLPQEFRSYWAARHEWAKAILLDPARGERVRRLASLLEAMTRSLRR